MTPQEKVYTVSAAWNIFVSWVGVAVTFLTDARVIALITLTYTACNLFFLLRDKWWRDRRRRNPRRAAK